MSIKKIMKDLPSDMLAARGLRYKDGTALTPCQRECSTRLGMSIQIEQEAYLSQHPEISAMLKIFISKVTHTMKKKSCALKEATDFFMRPADKIDEEIRERLGIPSEGPYVQKNKPPFRYHDENLEHDLRQITTRHYPEPPWKIPTTVFSTPDTVSSSFLSVKSSDTTLPTPEPVCTPQPTLSEIMFSLVSNTVDKAIYSGVNDAELRYDTAYVELSKAVEEAMEIPVIEIIEDIAELFFNSYKLFEVNILEKERVAAELAWERRMRKKMKRTMRRLNNFKGFETPPTPKSEVSSHESYKKPPPKPCICHPQFHYNRYGKDRFGIYLPRDEEYSPCNVTTTPAISVENIPTEPEGNERAEGNANAVEQTTIKANTQD